MEVYVEDVSGTVANSVSWTEHVMAMEGPGAWLEICPDGWRLIVAGAGSLVLFLRQPCSSDASRFPFLPSL